MKHPLTVTLILIALFVAAQLVGLFLVKESISDVVMINGTTTLAHTDTAIGARPELAGYQSFLYLFFGVLVGTILLLVLIKFRKVMVWKFWFFLAVFLSLMVAFGVLLSQLIALCLALILALWKVYKPNPWVHNATEILMYAGIAVLLVPIFDLFWVLLILLAISVYDMIAVWQTKHMVDMAQFQASSNVFAGLMVPKRVETPIPAPQKNAANSKTAIPKAAKQAPELRTPQGPPVAILGGGDIAFPLIFSGVVMEAMIRGDSLILFSKTPFEITTGLTITQFTPWGAYLVTLAVTLFATLALLFLFLWSKKGRFYPAMPFLTMGCLAGWLVTLLF